MLSEVLNCLLYLMSNNMYASVCAMFFYIILYYNFNIETVCGSHCNNDGGCKKKKKKKSKK